MPKQPKCKICKEEYKKFNSTQKACSVKCALKLVSADNRKKKKKEDKEYRKITRERKQALKTKPQLTKLAQPNFNKFIRLRDYEEGCISCDRTKEEVESQDMPLHGTWWDCGHFISVGANSTLRFEEFNAHKQCKSCNGGSGKYANKNATVAKQYRINLIEKIGLEKVEWLEGPHKPNNYTHGDIRAISKKYAKKARELEKLLT